MICTIGDLLLDVIVRLQEPLTPGDDAAALTSAEPGGQAANVAAWASHLGAEATFVGAFARDEAGSIARAALVERGVRLHGPILEGRTGIVVSLVDANANRTMASDRGVAPGLSPFDLEEEWFNGCNWLHVPAYSLAREPLATATVAAVRFARRRGARISLDLSATTVAAPIRERLEAVHADLVFATEGEAVAVETGGEVVLKRGPNGFWVMNGGRREYDAAPTRAVDSTGAGDALAAGYLVGGPELAAEAAARCVAKAGAMP